MLTSRALLLLLGISLVVACDATRFGVSNQQPPETSSAQARGIRGTVLDTSGAPAGGVVVRGTLISNNAGGLISNNGGGLVSNNGGGLISNGSGLYRTQSGSFETLSASDGSFSFNTSDDQVLTLEAIQRENLKAIQLGAAASSEPFTLRLAPTGHIRGKVVPADAAVTDLLNIDVFIPGTSYVAKTDAQGNFTLSNVPQGRFTLVADHRDLGRAVFNGLTVVSGETATPPALALSTRTPVLTSLAPGNGAPGALVTLKGEHFGVSSGKRPDVYVNGLAAQIVSASETQITATIPLGAISGTIRVSVSGLESTTLPFRVLRSLALFPDYQESDFQDPTAQPPGSDVIALGATRSYRVRAFDTEGRPVSAPAVSWSTLGTVASELSNGEFKPLAPGRLAIAAISGSVSTPPLSVEILSAITRVDVLPNPLMPLNPLPLVPVPEAERSQIPDWVQLQARVVLDTHETREIPFRYESLHPDLTISPTGRVRVNPGAADGSPSVKLIPIADPAKFRVLEIPVQQQGDLSFVIQ
jgi:uncharacterized protein (TIGR03437 family)